VDAHKQRSLETLWQVPGKPVPFYRYKNDLRPGATEQEILNLCHSHCRSDHFVLIDEYKAIPETFTLGATTSAWSSRGSAHGYRIFKKLS
jgi:hypothetical protein